MCKSRRELSNAYLLAKFGVDTAENEPCQVCPIPRNAAAFFEVPRGGPPAARGGEEQGRARVLLHGPEDRGGGLRPALPGQHLIFLGGTCWPHVGHMLLVLSKCLPKFGQFDDQSCEISKEMCQQYHVAYLPSKYFWLNLPLL